MENKVVTAEVQDATDVIRELTGDKDYSFAPYFVASEFMMNILAGKPERVPVGTDRLGRCHTRHHEVAFNIPLDSNDLLGYGNWGNRKIIRDDVSKIFGRVVYYTYEIDSSD